MFRMPGLPERDSVEEKRRTREAVVSNVIVFASIVLILKTSKFLFYIYLYSILLTYLFNLQFRTSSRNANFRTIIELFRYDLNYLRN